MKKISLLCACILSLSLLSGCLDKREIENNTFVILLGMDKTADTDIMVTIAFPLTQKEGSAGNANSGESGNYSVMSVKAPTLSEALTMFHTKLAGPLALYSVKTIVISQDLAQDDMFHQILSAWNYEEIRNTANILVSESNASDFIRARIENTIIDPLRQEELLLEQANQSAYYKPVQLLELLTDLKTDRADGVAMYGGVDTADEIPVQSENESWISGLAVFRGANLIGVLDTLETQAFTMLTQSKVKQTFTISDPLYPDSTIVVSILPKQKSKINTSIQNGLAVFDIDVPLLCTIEYVQSEADYTVPKNFSFLTEHLEQTCLDYMNGLIEKIQKDYQADILKLGNKLAYQFLTIRDWENYNWREKYKDAVIRLHVDLEIEVAGNSFSIK